MSSSDENGDERGGGGSLRRVELRVDPRVEAPRDAERPIGDGEVRVRRRGDAEAGDARDEIGGAEGRLGGRKMVAT